MKAQQPIRLIDQTKLLRDFPPSKRYLIGVSGGRDSIALLNLLVEFGYKKLVLCHLNHQLRGAASRSDARFVEKVARDLGRCPRIFLAHHADDLVETALLNLFRGASPGGMAAMRKVSIHRIGKTKLTILRPLLGVWRSEINSYVQEHALEFREDKTNATLRASRNKIRHRILSDIEKQFGRDVRKAIWRAAQIWSEEEALLDSMVSLPQRQQLDVASLRKLPVALQRRTILKWLRERKIADVGFDAVENVRALLQPGTKLARVNLPRDRHLRRRAGKIFIDKRVPG